jgi:hypothetical protein
MHCACAKVEAAVRNAVGVGNHRETRQPKRISTSVAGRWPKNGPVMPAEFEYCATARRI